MIEIIVILIAGIVFGRLFNSSGIVSKFASRITLTVWIMISALGYSVGSNPFIMNHLPSLGCESLIIAAFATAGSMIAVSVIRRFIKH